MNTTKALIALDQGTTSSRAVVFDLEGHILAVANEEFPQIFPQPGWVEHDPNQILRTQVSSLQRAVRRSGVHPENILAIGITDQRETTLLWDRETGKCVHNAIVWQCRRTAPDVERLVAEGRKDTIIEKTGLVPDAYFSGTKLHWLLERLNLGEEAAAGRLCFGTVDSFLVWNLCAGHPHVTDATNAGRTMLFNLEKQDWDDELLGMLGIPRACLPRVVDSCGVVGKLDPEILGVPVPVAAMAGDQHASLFGQACFGEGMVKNTYGTGCFTLMNTGTSSLRSSNGLVTSVGWRLGEETTYILEGSVYNAGSAIQWLRDELGLISTAHEIDILAETVPDNGGVYMVPAFTGLGAPYWDMYARGGVFGLTRGSSRAHLARAVLESIAYQVYDLCRAMSSDIAAPVSELWVDGGASVSDFLLQFQSELVRCPVIRPKTVEATADGAAYLAGLRAGVWNDLKELETFREVDRVFEAQKPKEEADRLLKNWQKAVDRALRWIEAE